jgi:hypothetical protein
LAFDARGNFSEICQLQGNPLRAVLPPRSTHGEGYSKRELYLADRHESALERPFTMMSL